MLQKPQKRTKHDPKHYAADAHALRCIAEVAMNVELFTIPLYMNALYSLKGFHQLTFGDTDIYQGRQWPGLEPTAEPENANEEAFNSVFGIFIQEMFHLEIAMNLASAIGVEPNLQNLLMDQAHGWTCYGPDKHVIPFVFDLRDSKDPDVRKLTVELGPMDSDRLQLFTVIEQPEDTEKQGWARDLSGGERGWRYLPYLESRRIPGWKEDSRITDLPLFGTITNLYHSYAFYAGLTYDDGDDRPLIERLFDEEKSKGRGYQAAMFNSTTQPGHPYAEFPKVKTTFEGVEKGKVYDRAVWMMAAIVDQGEGHPLEITDDKHKGGAPTSFVNMAGLVDDYQDVEIEHQPDKRSMNEDYPSFDDQGDGKSPPSDDSEARYDERKDAHYERFVELLEKVDGLETWACSAEAAKQRKWKASHFKRKGYVQRADDPNTPAQIATSMNNLAAAGATSPEFETMSRIATGALYGVVQSIEQFWRPQERKYDLPLGAMRASFGRFSVMWALYGRGPDLSKGIGIDPDDRRRLYNACRGLALDGPGDNDCASPQAYHTCTGANSCMGQGACGTVRPDCDELQTKPLGPCTTSSGGPLDKVYSAPAAHQCKALGGCAVPISASQRLRIGKVPFKENDGQAPPRARMNLYTFERVDGRFQPDDLESFRFHFGDSVYATAWKAYRRAQRAHGVRVPKTPPDFNDIQRVLIPV